MSADGYISVMLLRERKTLSAGFIVPCLPSDTAKPPTSLRVELGREVERAPLLAAILRELELGYDSWTAPYRR